MKILINCSNIRVGGGFQVSHSFINQLSQNHTDQFVIVFSSMLERSIEIGSFSPNFLFYCYNIKPKLYKIVSGKDAFLDLLVEEHQIERVFTVFGPSYWRPKVTHVCGYAKPQYIYTDSPFFKIISLSARIKLGLKRIFQLFDFKSNADVLITENPDVTLKISKILKKNAHTVYNTYHQVFDKRGSWRLINLPEFSGKYLLTISSKYPHKNLDIIPLVIRELVRRNIHDYRFVVTLNKGDFSSSEQVDRYILYLGKVDVEHCPPLYEQCHYMFLPTLLECFSASYAEAMRMKRVILTSDLEFARAICGEGAIYFNPLSPSDIVDRLIEIDQDKIKRDQIVEIASARVEIFDSSQQRAEKYLEIIKNS